MSLPPPSDVPPFTGVPATVSRLARDLLVGSTVLDDAAVFVSGPARAPGLEGEAGAAYQRRATLLGEQTEAMSQALRAAAGEVFAHGDELSRLQARHDWLEVEQAALARAVRDLNAIAALPGEHPLHRHVRADAGPLAERLRLFERDLSGWVRDLEASEQRVLAALQRVDTAAEVGRWHGGRPDVADAVVARMPVTVWSSPAAAARWWRGLDRSEQLAVLAAHPEVVGHLDGLPARTRHEANSLRMDRDVATLSAIPAAARTSYERRWLERAEAAVAARDRMDDHRDPWTRHPPPVQVLVYEPTAFDGDGRVVMGVGDLDSARHVAVTVPGFGTDAVSAPEQAERAMAVREASRHHDHDADTAVLFAIDYDAPDGRDERDRDDLLAVVTDRAARDGGDRLAALLDSLAATRGDDPHVTLVGHSYGSTTAAFGAAAAAPGRVDDLVLTGSPGVGRGVEHADDLGLPDGHVFVGRSSADPVAHLGGHGDALGVVPDLSALGLPPGPYALGDDPATRDFGAVRFRAEDVDRGGAGTAGLAADHNSYYQHDTESLANIARVVTGHPGEVEAAPSLGERGDVGPHDLAQGALGLAGEGLQSTALGMAELGDRLVWDNRLVDIDWDAHGAEQVRDVIAHVEDATGAPPDPEALRTPTTPGTHP